MGKSSDEDIFLVEIPARGESSRDFSQRYRRRRGKCKQEPKDSMNNDDDILAPRTPDTLTTKHPTCQTEQPEDVLQKGQSELMIDENCEDICHNIDDKSASDVSVWSSEGHDHAVKITENVHGRKKIGCVQDVLVYRRRKRQELLVYQRRGKQAVRKELLVFQRRGKQAVRKELLVYQRRWKQVVRKELLVYRKRKWVGKHDEKTNMSEEKKLVCCDPSTQMCKGPKKRVLKEMPRPVLMISKHTGSRKQNKKSLVCSKSKKSLVRLRPKMQSILKVDLDEKTIREWKILMYNEDSKGIEEDDEWERERWEKERNSLHDQVKSFISNMQPIQGEMHFSPWKGSVMDSVVGAYLSQNVSDTLSSSAFISLAAKYPVGATRVYSRSKSVQKRKMAEVDDIAEAIKKRGMNNNLAARIKNCLNTLERDLGTIDLEWIRYVPPHKANAQPSLPDIQEKDDANLRDPMALAESHMMIEVSDSDAKDSVERDIEDFGLDGIPQIRIDDKKLKENIQKFINKRNIPLQEAEMSNTVMVLTSETGSIHAPKLKNLSHLRTQHQV
ncbi:UNVERIFIED_CONTAM: DNA glycosylase/AP lyase ROS1 [Sesamum latifolium]|uniref:DNA glycosylase/AP lyase ROS1 n=1 Tax=Sesamum latifolium TaxID=2727402 RepID=A0AAW2X4Q3_9LAMI